MLPTISILSSCIPDYFYHSFLFGPCAGVISFAIPSNWGKAVLCRLHFPSAILLFLDVFGAKELSLRKSGNG